MIAFAPVLLIVGLLAGWWLARGRQQLLQLPESDRISLNLAAICGAMLGARIPFWLEQGFTAGNWLWWSDGKTILGGIIGAYITVEVVKECRRIKVLTGDSYALPAAVMIGFGRIACFCSGCCYGTPTDLPWGIVFSRTPDAGSIARHPTQVYEALFHFAAATIILIAERRKWLTGQRLKAYLIAYLAFRFITEFIRPEPRYWLSLTAYQWTALLLIVPLVIQWHLHAQRLTATSTSPEVYPPIQ